jgi:hypothetical protein
MSLEEVEAFRRYVHDGGQLYASRYTSLTETSGTKHDEFMLADVFGCSFDSNETGAVVYLRPVHAELAAAIAPDEVVTHRSAGAEITGALRLRQSTRSGYSRP